VAPEVRLDVSEVSRMGSSSEIVESVSEVGEDPNTWLAGGDPLGMIEGRGPRRAGYTCISRKQRLLPQVGSGMSIRKFKQIQRREKRSGAYPRVPSTPYSDRPVSPGPDTSRRPNISPSPHRCFSSLVYMLTASPRPASATKAMVLRPDDIPWRVENFVLTLDIASDG